MTKRKDTLARRGRPSGLTPETRAKLIAAFGKSPSFAIVAGTCGVPEQTLRRWERRGRDGDEFYEDIAHARAAGIAATATEMLDVLRSIAMEGGPTQPAVNAAKLWLQWYVPEETSETRRHQITVTHKEEDAESKFARMTVEELEAQDAILARLADDNDIEDAEFEECDED